MCWRGNKGKSAKIKSLVTIIGNNGVLKHPIGTGTGTDKGTLSPVVTGVIVYLYMLSFTFRWSLNTRSNEVERSTPGKSIMRGKLDTWHELKGQRAKWTERCASGLHEQRTGVGIHIW